MQESEQIDATKAMLGRGKKTKQTLNTSKAEHQVMNKLPAPCVTWIHELSYGRQIKN